MIRVSVRRITLILGLVAASFSVLGLVTQVMAWGHGPFQTTLPQDWADIFDLDSEADLPAWFQTSMLLACAALSGMIAASRAPADRFKSHWIFLAFLFLYFSADEAATLHEAVGYVLSDWIPGSWGVYTWLIAGVPAVIALGAFGRPFLAHLPPAVRHRMVLGVALYLMGAVGMEAVQARLSETDPSFTFSMVAVVEETLEMAGQVTVASALLLHLMADPARTVFEVQA